MPDIQDTTKSTASMPGSAHRGARIIVILTVLTVAIAATALARDYFGWASGGGTPAATTASAGPNKPLTTNPAPGTAPPSAGSSPVRLDTLAVEAGAANLGKLPRQLAGQPEYDRPVVINCPTNTGSDKQRDVTYRLQRRYLDLTSTVRPFFPSPDDREGIVLVYAQVAIRQKDGTVTRVTRGQQFEARMDSPQGLAANVEGADELTLRVQCQYPGGSVVLTAATVSEG